MLAFALSLAALAIAVVACNLGSDSPIVSPTPTPSSAPLPTLAVVAELPEPTVPDWIAQISPTGSAEPLAQIRMRFEHPLIPLERLDSPGQQDLLDKFQVEPALGGQFRFLTPRMVGFQADRALPKATRIQVTLKAGLADLEGNALAEDLAWTFQTEAIELSGLPSSSSPIDLEPQFGMSSNVELDLDSVRDRLTFVSEADEQPVAIAITPVEQPRFTTPAEQFDASQQSWRYRLSPDSPLRKATRYRLQFAAGIMPAYGNLPSQMEFVGTATTYSPLAFEELKLIGLPSSNGAFGRFVNGSPRLIFNNPIEAESAIANITVSPAPKPDIPLVSSGWRYIEINPYALDPNISYTIEIGSELADTFGQTLGTPIALDYRSGDLAAGFWAPEGFNIFPADNNLQLDITSVNLPDGEFLAAYQQVNPVDLAYADSAFPGREGEALLPPIAEWSSVSVANPSNEMEATAVPLRDRLGGRTGLLAYGVKARVNEYKRYDGQLDWWEPEYYGLVQLTNLGVLAQVQPESAIVHVHHLSDGSPASAAIEIYESQLDKASEERTPKSQLEPCAVGRATDGLLQLTAAELQTCMAGQPSFDNPPQLVVVARENDDWAFTRLRRYSGAWGYGIWTGWDSGEPRSRGTIFSDRQLYQPGEEAQFTAVAYYLKDGELVRDGGQEYAVELRHPDGNTVSLGSFTTNDYGTFSVPFQFDRRQPLGFYSIEAEASSGASISGSFRLAEFKPPNFKVDLALSREMAFPGDAVEASVQSNYLFGAPVDGGRVEYLVKRQRAFFVPEGWGRFSFGRAWYWPEETPTVPGDVLQEEAQLDAAGEGMQSVTVADDLPYPMTYRFDAQVSDVSNLSVAGSQSFVALPSDRLIGLKGDFIGKAEEPFAVEVIATDETGEVLRNQAIHLELQRIEYRTVTQTIEGSEVARNQAEFITVDEVNIRSAKAAVTAELTPTESGTYRIRANFRNAQSDVTATDLRIWVTGGEPVFWGDRGDRLSIRLDKGKYEIGDIATALIESPYTEADLYFAVIRHDTLYSTQMTVEGGAPQVQFTVTADMLPNAAVEAILVRQGEPLSELEPESIDGLSRVGFVPFSVDLSDRYLDVEVTPEQESVLPGGEQTVKLAAKDAEGNPVEAQFTVMAVNEAILQLNGYRPPDLVATVFAQQPISTRFADNRPDVVLESPEAEIAKGWGFGGGLSAGGGSTRVRTDFRPLAYYNGSVLTDENGEAAVTFALPDDLTTWRVMVVAATQAMQFGSGDSSFIATQPLLTNPILPQFARLGDEFEIGVATTNTTEATGTYQVRGQLEGDVDSLPLKFAESPDGMAIERDVRAQSGTQGFRFPVRAEAVGTATIQFETQLGDVADAFKVPLEVRVLNVTEQVVETGVADDRVEIPIHVDDTVLPNMGGLELNLASTLLPPVVAAMEPLLPEDWLHFLEPAASRLEIAAQIDRLQEKYGAAIPDFDAEAIAADALEVLAELQQPDGGFAFWPGQNGSSFYYTPYAARSIARAAAAGVEIDSQLRDRLTGYLSAQLADPGGRGRCSSRYCRNRVRLDSLLALAELGDERTSYLSELYDWRDRFNVVERIRLARYLDRFPEWQAEAEAMADQLQEIVYETGRTATINLPQGWRWLDSNSAAQSEILQLFVSQNRDLETVDRALKGLLALRRSDGLWRNRYDDAAALTGLVSYSDIEPVPPQFTAIAQLGDRTLADVEFSGYDNSNHTEKVPMADLPQGQNSLTLSKDGDGTLHYLTAYSYRLPGDLPGQLNGLRVTRQIRPANQAEVLQTIGLNPPEEPLAVAAGQVFDIGLEIIADRPVTHMVIRDPLPAGFEAVDTSFQTSTSYFQAGRDSWEIDLQTIRKDSVTAYADFLNAGVYEMHYLVRSVTPGRFIWPGAQVHLEYAPEEFGRTASSSVQVD